jgi:tetratricopeptide (TPR) repeat protein
VGRWHAALALALALACTTTPLHERDWLEVRTPHFEITSSLGEEETRRLARDAERFHAAIEFVMGVRLRAPAVPTRIVAFDGRGFRRPLAVRGARSWFRTSPREALLVLRAGDGFADATESLRHEYVHHVVRSHAGFGLPLWFDEGAAEFLSTVDVREEYVELGILREDHVRLLRGEHWMPLFRILEAEDLYGWGSRHRAQFAAGSWAFVHYLNFGPGDRSARQEQLARYLQQLGEGAPPERAIRAGFGAGPDELDDALHRYVVGERFGSVAVGIGPSQVGPFEAAPLPRDEAVARLGWLAIAIERPETARELFERSVAADPRNARAHAGLGAAELLRGDFDAAIPHYGRALGVAPEDPVTQLDVGDYYLRRAGATAEPGERARFAALARQHYAKAGELDAALPASYLGYGETFLLEGEQPERGVDALARAGRMLPASVEVRLLEARVHARLGQRAAARRLALEVISRSHSEAARSEAREILDAVGGARRTTLSR